jgi:hypothetical protein
LMDRTGASRKAGAVRLRHEPTQGVARDKARSAFRTFASRAGGEDGVGASRDPLRSYFRRIGGVPLLTREGEIDRKADRGRRALGLPRDPPVSARPGRTHATRGRPARSRLLDTLSPREREIVRLRFGMGGATEHTLEEVGNRFSLTRETHPADRSEGLAPTARTAPHEEKQIMARRVMMSPSREFHSRD